MTPRTNSRSRIAEAMAAVADEQDLPVTIRHINALAAAVMPFVTVTLRRTTQSPAGFVPTPDQLDVLVAKTRERRLSGAEVDALAAGIEALRRHGVPKGVAVLRNDPLAVECPTCGAGVGERCKSAHGTTHDRSHYKRRVVRHD